jgi:hypothetical protein
MSLQASSTAPTVDQLKLVETWRTRIRHLKMAHYEAYGSLDRTNKWLSAIVIAASAAAGPATYLVDKLKVESLTSTQVGLVLLGLSATVLATLQIFLRHSERAEKHHAAGATYAKLEMDIERLAVFPPETSERLASDVLMFRDEWQRLTGQSPVIPERIFRRYRRDIEGDSTGPPAPVR